MKITIERPFYKQKISLEIEGDDLPVSKIVEDLIEPAFLALGFSQCAIDRALGNND